MSDKSDAQDVCISILFAEAQPFAQIGPHDITIENLDFMSTFAEDHF